MWAHDAEKHHGICLGFDVPKRGEESLLSPAVYNASRLQFTLDHTQDLLGIDQTFIHTLIATKSHPEQRRLIAALPPCRNLNPPTPRI
jgi:hypothetical protein